MQSPLPIPLSNKLEQQAREPAVPREIQTDAVRDQIHETKMAELPLISW